MVFSVNCWQLFADKGVIKHESRPTVFIVALQKGGIIDLVRSQNFPKNYHFLPPDTHRLYYGYLYMQRFYKHHQA